VEHKKHSTPKGQCGRCGVWSDFFEKTSDAT
jgi:hypothetical protein